MDDHLIGNAHVSDSGSPQQRILFETARALAESATLEDAGIFQKPARRIYIPGGAYPEMSGWALDAQSPGPPLVFDRQRQLA